MTLFQRIFIRLFFGVGLMSICIYLLILILEDASFLTVIASIVSALGLGMASCVIVWDGKFK
jgi:Trk-type K+ transport system membrane component